MKKVKCVDNTDIEALLTFGGNYLVLSEGGSCYRIKDNKGNICWYIKSRFIEVKTKEQDQDIKPTYYNKANGISPFEYIKANNLDFFEGNVIKYITRYKNKNGLEDLKKARTYLNEIIKQFEEKNNNSTLQSCE